MREIFLYDNSLTRRIYLQDGPNWEKRREFDDVKGLVDYLNCQEAEKIRDRANLAVCLSGGRVAELEEALRQVHFRKAPEVTHKEPPAPTDRTHER